MKVVLSAVVVVCAELGSEGLAEEGVGFVAEVDVSESSSVVGVLGSLVEETCGALLDV